MYHFAIEHRSDITSQKTTFLIFKRFEYHILVEHDEKPLLPKTGSWGLEIWPREYLISPIGVNCPGS